ncbi:TetR/AcrR family transcriptional regulator [Desulfitobacterium metallireducens]|uniref:TetR family transcriptional regulator n=1 Tax=Desulfitobacterium metallireducens DSM 15288 TaxID=871968 RepID=W0E895_9FIRM|nr:TetR/AcrR family transcriptional regulator [Desulfitobacterium metallireducens]AHF06992.1 TetR family transcriptional regulator [Desulfitobacterium metallireducens DSM 15288]
MVYNKTEKILEKQQLRSQKIIKAVREILSEKDMGKVSIKSIAQKAGIATGTFYLYFADKETLIDTVVQEIYQELLEHIKNERAQYSNGFDKLQATMEVCIQLFMKEKHLAKTVLVDVPQKNTALNSKYTYIENDLIRLAKIDIDELMDKQLIPKQDTLVSAIAFVGAFREVILSWISTGEPLDSELAQKTLIEYNMRALGRYII